MGVDYTVCGPIRSPASVRPPVSIKQPIQCHRWASINFDWRRKKRDCAWALQDPGICDISYTDAGRPVELSWLCETWLCGTWWGKSMWALLSMRRRRSGEFWDGPL